MATVAKKAGSSDVKMYNYAWSGKDKTGKVQKGEVRATGESMVLAQLRRQGLTQIAVKKAS